MSADQPESDWTCHGWEDHERGQLLDGDRMTFRERLLWLQDADRAMAWLETRRRWIDKDGVIHEPVAHAAEDQSVYRDGPADRTQTEDRG